MIDKEKLKILFLTDFIPPRSVGGAAQSAWRVICELHKRGHEMFVVATVQDRQYEGIENRNGIIIHNVYSQYDDRWRAYVSLYNPPIVRTVKKILNEIKPDIVHADNIHYYVSYATLKVARKNAKRVFLTTRDFMMIAYGKLEATTRECGNEQYRLHWWYNLRQAKKRYNPLRNIVIRHYLKYVDVIFSNSKSLADILACNKILGVVPMHNGLAIDSILPTAHDVKTFTESFGMQGKHIVLFPARVSPAKGLFIMLDAIQIVLKKIPDVMLVVAGVQERDRSTIENYAKQLGIVHAVKQLPWIAGRNLVFMYCAADIVTAPSLYPDPFPTVNLDAALYKKPVITTCFGGAKEFVIDGVTGYVINPFDINALSARIIALLENPDLAKQFGIAGYDRLSKHFTVEKQTDKLLRWYTSNQENEKNYARKK